MIEGPFFTMRLPESWRFQTTAAGDLMLTIEAMKMETGLYADRAGLVKALHVQPGAQVDAKDLLVELEAA